LAAADALLSAGDLDAARAAYEALAEHPDEAVAAHAAFNAATLGGDPVLLETALRSPNPVIREEAALRLAQRERGEAAQRLARAAELLERGLAPPHGRGPERLIALLGEVRQALGDPAAEQPLQAASESEDPFAAPRAALALAELRLGQGRLHGGMRALALATASGHPEHRPRAAFLMGGLYADMGATAQALEAYADVERSRHPVWAPEAVARAQALRERLRS
jgi:hypothetical protein